MSNPKESPKKPTVYTGIPPGVKQRQRGQWRIAYVMVHFEDNTLGYVALAAAPVVETPEHVLRETADLILRGLMTTYPVTPALGVRVMVQRLLTDHGEIESHTQVSSLAEFERHHPVEYSAFYFQFPFLERLVIAYEVIGSHDESNVMAFSQKANGLQRTVDMLKAQSEQTSKEKEQAE